MGRQSKRPRGQKRDKKPEEVPLPLRRRFVHPGLFALFALAVFAAIFWLVPKTPQPNKSADGPEPEKISSAQIQDQQEASKILAVPSDEASVLVAKWKTKPDKTEACLADLKEAHRIRTAKYPADRFPNGHIALVEVLNLLGVAHAEKGNVDVSVKHFREARTILSKLDDIQEQTRQCWIAMSHNNEGHCLFLTGGQPSLIVDAFNEAVKASLLADCAFGDGVAVEALRESALTCERLGRGAEAEANYREANRIAAGRFGRDRYPGGHALDARAACDLARYLCGVGQFQEADPLAARAVTIMRRCAETNDILRASLAYSLVIHGSCRFFADDDAAARQCAKEAQQIIDMEFTGLEWDDPDFALARLRAATLTAICGRGANVSEKQTVSDLLAAEKRWTQFDEDKWDRKPSLTGYDLLFRFELLNGLQLRASAKQKDSYLSQMEALVRTIEKFDAKRGVGLRAQVLNDQGNAHYLSGKPAEAVPLLEESIRLANSIGQVFGKTTALHNLGMAEVTLGKTESGLAKLRESLALRREHLQQTGRTSQGWRVVESLGAIVAANEQLERVDENLRLLKEAHDMAQELVKADPGPVGLYLQILELYVRAAISTGSAADTDAACAEILRVAKSTFVDARFPDGHPKLASALNACGVALLQAGQITLSLDMLRAAHDMLVRLAADPTTARDWGLSQETVLLYKVNFANVLAANGLASEANRMIAEVDKLLEQSGINRGKLSEPVIYTKFLVDLLSGRSSDVLLPRLIELEGQWRKRARRIAATSSRREALLMLEQGSIAVSQLAQFDRQTPESLEAIVQNFWCRRQLADQVITLKDAPQRVRELDAVIAKKLRDSATDNVATGSDLDELIAQKEAEERKIGRAAVPFREIAIKDLAAALPEGAVHVELLHLPKVVTVPSDKPGQKTMMRVPYYFAVVIPRTGTPQLVRLPEADRIDAAVTGWLKGIDERFGTDAQRSALVRSASVRDLIWKPIAAALSDSAKTVYLAPDGLLGNIPWAALPADKPGEFLIDTFQFVTVPHGPLLYDLLTAKPRPRDGGKLLAVGGVEYGPEPPSSADVYLTRGYKGNYLPASLDEVRTIGKQTGGSVLDGKTPTPERLKKELDGITQLHLATHGFFDEVAFGKREEQIRTARRNWTTLPAAKVPARDGGITDCPLAFCGLVLAGANQAPPDDPHRGLLLGNDIAQQDLRHLRSVVLSGCQTATGGAIPGATTLTLQRAFHVAGCRNVVGSLWKVGDDETSRFMTEFYRLRDGEKKPAAEALRAAQRQLRATCPDPVKSVKDWAGFTISGVGD